MRLLLFKHLFVYVYFIYIFASEAAPNPISCFSKSLLYALIFKKSFLPLPHAMSLLHAEDEFK